MIIPMLCVTIFVILVVWFLLPRVARLMIHTPTAISIFVCLSMVQLMAVFISMRCTLCGHFLQVDFFSDKLVLTSVTPASSAPVLQTPKATSSTLYFDSLTVNAGNGGFLHCIQMDTSVNAANQVVSVGADIAFD